MASKEDLAALRLFYREVAIGNFWVGKDVFDPDIEWEWSSSLGAMTGNKTYRGFDEVSAATKEWLRSFEWFRIELQELVDLGERVVALTRSIGRPHGSEASVTALNAEVWTMRGGKAVAHRSYDTWEEALEAAKSNASPGPAAIFRRHLDHIEHGEMVQAKADYAEDAVLEADPTGEQGLLLLGTFHGREAAGDWVENWFSSFEPGSYRFNVKESIENGDRVFMTVHHTARGGASGVDVELRTYHAVTVRDGLIVRHAFSSEGRETILQYAGIESG